MLPSAIAKIDLLLIVSFRSVSCTTHYAWNFYLLLYHHSSLFKTKFLWYGNLSKFISLNTSFHLHVIFLHLLQCFTGQRPNNSYRRCRCYTAYDWSFSCVEAFCLYKVYFLLGNISFSGKSKMTTLFASKLGWY